MVESSLLDSSSSGINPIVRGWHSVMMEDRLTPLASGQEMVALRSMLRRGSASPAVFAVMLDEVVGLLAVVAGTNGGRE